MRKNLLITFIAAMLMIPSAAFATDSDSQSDRSDQAAEETRPVDEAPTKDQERDTEPERDGETDITRRCLESDKVSDRCCAHFADESPERCREYICNDTDVLTYRCCLHFADEYPERCRDHTCQDSDVLTDRCCHYLAVDHPERCRDDKVDTPNYRQVFWRLFQAGEWGLIIRLLKHLKIV
jgi:hypothetical protein